MRIALECVCTHAWQVAANKAGTDVTCPACGRSVAVPGSQPKASEPSKDAEPSEPSGASGAGFDFLNAPAVGDPTANLNVLGAARGEPINWLGPSIIGGVLLVLVISLVLYGIFGGSGKTAGTRENTSPPPGTVSIFTDRSSKGDNPFGARGSSAVGDGTGTGAGGLGGGAADAGGQTGAAAAGTGNLDAPEGEGATLADPNAPKDDASAAQIASATLGEAADAMEDGLNVPELAGPGSPKSASIGGGGTFGARGRKGGGFGRGGMTPQSQQAVADGLKWLATVQEKDGHWDSKKWGGDPTYDLGVTGLATLAFLADGNTHLDKKPYQGTVKRALEYILSLEQEDGSFKRNTFYEQGIATIVLCELIGMTEDKELIDPAQRAINYIISQAGPEGGYVYAGPGTDMSVTGFQIMAVKSAILAHLDVPEPYIEKLKSFLALVTTPDGAGKYNPGTGGTPSMSAAVLFCRIFLGYGLDDPMVMKGAEQIKTTGPQISDEYYTYYATYCMYQLGEGPWLKWNSVVRDAVVALQEKKDHQLRGSWPPENAKYKQAGRIYSTAMSVMTLQVYYRYLPMYH